MYHGICNFATTEDHVHDDKIYKFSSRIAVVLFYLTLCEDAHDHAQAQANSHQHLLLPRTSLRPRTRRSGALAGDGIITMHTIAYGLTSLLGPINTKDER